MSAIFFGRRRREPLDELGLKFLLAVLVLLFFSGCVVTRSQRIDPGVPEIQLPPPQITPVKADVEQGEILWRAIEDLKRPRGCWAYTLTLKRKRENQDDVIEIGRFDPSKAEANQWSLLSVNQHTPTSEETSSFLKRIACRSRSRPSLPERGATAFSRAPQSFRLESGWDNGSLRFSLAKKPRASESKGGALTPYTYVIDGETKSLLKVTYSTSEEYTVYPLAIPIHISYVDEMSEYSLIEAALPPFLSHQYVRFRVSMAGHDFGEWIIDAHFSDYKRVPCYNDRFEAKIGEVQWMDFVHP